MNLFLGGYHHLFLKNSGFCVPFFFVVFFTGGGRIVDPGSTIRRTDGYKSGVSEKKKNFFPS